MYTSPQNTATRREEKRGKRKEGRKRREEK